jgi:hypothetical protein
LGREGAAREDGAAGEDGAAREEEAAEEDGAARASIWVEREVNGGWDLELGIEGFKEGG